MPPGVDPHENEVVAAAGSAMLAPAQPVVQSSVWTPPAEPVKLAVSVAISGGNTSAGLIETPVMPGHRTAPGRPATTPASTATKPPSTGVESAWCVGMVQVTTTSAVLVAFGATESGGELPAQGSPLLSLPERVTT